MEKLSEANSRAANVDRHVWMQEVLKYLRANGYKTYIVTGGGQDFVRVYAEAPTAFRPSRWSARGRHEVRLRQGRQAVPDQGARSCCSTTTTPASPRAFT